MSAEFLPLTKAQRLDRLDARLAVVEAALAGYGPPPPAKPEAPAEEAGRTPQGGYALSGAEADEVARLSFGEGSGYGCGPGGAVKPPLIIDVPPGVVSPHVKRNLDALALWTSPDRWVSGLPPQEAHRVRAMLDHLHGLVMTAMAGEDVPLP